MTRRQSSERELFLKYMAQTSPSPMGIEVSKAEGCWLFGPKGESYLDLISGISVANVGHNHPHVVEAVNKQVKRHMHLMVYGEYIQSPQVKLAEKLASLLPSSLSSTYFVNSGSEAIEGALKLSKRHSGRPMTVSLEGAYHGSTLGALSLMGNEFYRHAYRPLVPGNRIIKPNDIGDLHYIDQDVACVVVEPVMGEAGVIVLETSYLKALSHRCKEVGALLVFDEIQTGLGRTGSLFAFEQSKVVPDILCLAKALGGGMPLGAFISSPQIMSSLAIDPVLGHITTFGGHPVSCAAALASLEVIMEEDLIKRARQMSELFVSELKSFPQIKEIRNSGLLMALELGDSDQVQQFLTRLREQGVLSDWFLFKDTAIRLAPPLIITEDEVKEACKIMKSTLSSL